MSKVIEKKTNFVICDATKIILNDGVTIIPGYIEVSGNKIKMFGSTDPNNKLPRKDSFGRLKNLDKLRNRVKDENGKSFIVEEDSETKHKVKGTKHFFSNSTFERYIQRGEK